MDADLSIHTMTGEQDRRISEAVEQQRARVRNFIRSRVPDPADAEDILQEVFYELVAAYRLTKPIEQVGAWLFRVARNRIIDRFRKQKPEASSVGGRADDENTLSLEELLPSPDASPESVFVRNVLMDE